MPILDASISANLWNSNVVYFKIIVENEPIRWSYFLGISYTRFSLCYSDIKEKHEFKNFS